MGTNTCNPTNLPITEVPLVLRTDFSNPSTWDAICKGIQQPTSEGFEANVKFIDDPSFDGLSTKQLLALVPKDETQAVIFVVDQIAINSEDHPVLVVKLELDPEEGSGEEFRAVPSEVGAIGANLSIANMDFEDFSTSVDGNGVFRGF